MWYRRLNRSTKGLIWGITLLILIVICSTIWITGHERTPHTTTSVTPKTPAAAQSGKTTTIDGAIVLREGATSPVCGQDFDLSIPAPQNADDITWDGTKGPWEITTMEGAGPAAYTNSGIPYCYPQSEAGAVLAATNMIIVWDSPYRVILGHFAFTGAYADDYVEALDNLTEADLKALKNDEIYLPLAYRVKKLSPTHYQVYMLGQIGVSLNQTVVVLDLYYKDGDWRWEPNLDENHVHYLELNEYYTVSKEWHELRPGSLSRFEVLDDEEEG